MRVGYFAGFVLVIVLTLYYHPANVLAQDIRLQVNENDIDTEEFPTMRVAVGVWDDKGMFVPNKSTSDFILQEDGQKFRYPRKIEVAGPDLFRAKMNSLRISLVIDMDPNLRPDQREFLEQTLCNVVGKFALSQDSSSDLIEVWSSDFAVSPLQPFSYDHQTICNGIRLVTNSSPSFSKLNEILQKLLTRQAKDSPSPILLASTRKIESAVVTNIDILRLRDMPASDPIDGTNIQNGIADLHASTREYLIRLSTFTQRGQPAYLDLAERGPSKEQQIGELIRDVYKYKHRYVLIGESELWRSDQEHTLTIGFAGMRSNPLRFVIGNTTCGAFPLWVPVLMCILFVFGLVPVLYLFWNSPKYTYP